MTLKDIEWYDPRLTREERARLIQVAYQVKRREMRTLGHIVSDSSESSSDEVDSDQSDSEQVSDNNSINVLKKKSGDWKVRDSELKILESLEENDIVAALNTKLYNSTKEKTMQN